MGSFSPTIANNPTTQGGGKGGAFPAPTQQTTSQQPMQFQGKGGYGNAPVDPSANMQQVLPASLDQNAINSNPQGFAQWQQGANQQEQQHPGSTMNAPTGGFNGQPSQGKGSMPQNMQMPQQQPQQQQFGKGGTTNSATSGQPQMGDPSQNPQSGQMFQPQRNFPNTIQQVDNTGNTVNTTNQPISAGKGKGA